MLRKHFLQVGGSHALVEVADVKLVHGGGLRAGRGPQQGRAGGRARAASLLGREAGRRAAGGGSRKLSLHPTPKLSGARGAEGGQRTRRGRRGVRGGPGEVPSASREADDAAQLVPSVRNPSERAGVSRFSAAALAPPLNKIDLEKKKMERGWEGRQSHVVKAPTHPEGEDPRRLRALRPSSPAQPTNLAPGWMGWGGHSTHPRVSPAGGAALPELHLPPPPLQESGP